MARLPRPTIPLAVKLTVAYRQLGYSGEMFDGLIESAKQRRRFGAALADALIAISEKLKCPREELHLDHDPALENREKIIRDGEIVGYIPDANDPDYLIYRPFSGQYEGSHYIKTHVRGSNGQYSDTTLAKRERRRQKKALGKKRKKAWPSRKLVSRSQWPKRKKAAR